jgi:hypothetical protein
MSESETEMTLYPERVVEDGEIRYVPFIGDVNQVGYRVERPGRPVTYLYFNPSNTEDYEADDDEAPEPSVFVYRGAAGTPCYDQPENWYGLDAPDGDTLESLGGVEA